MSDEISISRNIEEYLEALHILARNGEKVTTTRISEYLNIAPASVTEMLKKLADKGYADYSPYQGATLTDKGLEIGKKMSRKHRLLERFLHDVLRIGNDRVHAQACDMEHSLSDEAEESLCRFLNHPDRCPDDGKTIPPCDLKIQSCEECMQLHSKGLEEVGKRKENLVSLSDLKEGQCGKVFFIRGGHNVLQRLLDMGLTPSTSVSIIKSAPFDGPVEILVRGSRLALGRGIASKVFVDLESQNLAKR
jgi:DtxR family Mn-dependent transcriptional regulator